jgi:hypothetical protein
MAYAAKQTLASFAKVVIGSLTGGWGGLLSGVAGETIDYWKNQTHLGAITDSDSIIKKTAEAIFTHAERVGWSEERVIALGGLAADRWRSRRPSFDEMARLNFEKDVIINRVIGNGDNIDREDVEPVRTILTIAVNQILEAMPPSQILAYMRELLRRSEVLIEKLDSTREDCKFEEKYRQAVVLALNKLEPYGVPDYLDRRSYQLASAFIMLRGTCSLGRSGNQSASLEPGSLDEILPHGQRFLIRGEAGFGKTTLLRWLAIQCARNQHDGLLKPWNDRIPFFLQLRDFGETCPLPEEFPGQVASAVLGLKPKDWVTKHLDSGRALLLIDGLDEIAVPKRKHVRKWLENLLLNFRNVAIIVTSRPAAVTNEWLEDHSFVDVELQPMSPAEIDLAIDRWYVTVGIVQSAYGEESYYKRRADMLKREVRLRPAIRNLIRTPALCALLCRMWVDLTNFPVTTMARFINYSLNMLLQERDVQRGIRRAFHFNSAEHEHLLGELAYWMIRNGHFSVAPSDALKPISRALKNISHAKDDPKDVLRHLSERVGILKLSPSGRVEFLYQAFQEYLAARAVTDALDTGLLIHNAHLDHWSRVVVYSSALADMNTWKRMIKGLIAHSGKDDVHKRQLLLLTIECYGMKENPDPNLEKVIEPVIQAVVPPADSSEADSIAAGGSLSVPHLRGHRGRSAKEVAACVRALEIIGTDAALEAVEEYRSDERSPVLFEFLRLAEQQGHRRSSNT